jgi:putative oxidoreductase
MTVVQKLDSSEATDLPTSRGMSTALRASIGLFMLRVSFGAIILTHGIPKLFGSAHGSLKDPLGAVAWVSENILHLPGPAIFAWLVAILETAGAAMIMLGLGTRIIASLFVIQMAVICYVLAPNWVWDKHGMEYPVMLGFVALYIGLTGAGPLSLDRLVAKRFSAR